MSVGPMFIEGLESRTREVLEMAGRPACGGVRESGAPDG